MGYKLRDPEEARRQTENVESFVRYVSSCIDAACCNPKAPAESDETADGGGCTSPAAVDTIENLASLFEVLRLRAREIVARSQDPFGWVTHRIAPLSENFFHEFRAIERNSKGGYRIVHNLAEHDAQSYYLHCDIGSFRGERIRMPAVFQDIIRDLIANARKYTAPGGRILAGTYEDQTELRVVVEDTGRGVPADEIPGLVHFGVRGSNVEDRPTRGGGFGLTKAYYVTKRLGGRMWIDSTVDVGTQMKIVLPTPV